MHELFLKKKKQNKKNLHYIMSSSHFKLSFSSPNSLAPADFKLKQGF